MKHPEENLPKPLLYVLCFVAILTVVGGMYLIENRFSFRFGFDDQYRSEPMPLVVPVVVSGLALLMLVWKFWWDTRFWLRAKPVEATIRKIEKPPRLTQDGTYRRVKINYRFYFCDYSKTILLKSDLIDRVAVGGKITVFVDRNDPEVVKPVKGWGYQ